MSAMISTLRTTFRGTFRDTFRGTFHGVLGLSKSALDLEPLTPEAVHQRRKVCAYCPAATRTKKLGLHPIHTLTPLSVCRACKCNLHAKTRLAGETCPRHQW